MATRTAAFWTFIAVLVLLHLTFRIGLGIGVVPDLLVVAALLGGRRLGGWESALYGLVLGILADSLAVVAFGATSVAFVIVCYLGSRLRVWFEGDSLLFILAYAFVGAWLVEVIRFFAGGYGTRGMPVTYLYMDAPLQSLYVALAALASLIAYRAVTGSR